MLSCMGRIVDLMICLAVPLIVTVHSACLYSSPRVSNSQWHHITLKLTSQLNRSISQYDYWRIQNALILTQF